MYAKIGMSIKKALYIRFGKNKAAVAGRTQFILDACRNIPFIDNEIASETIYLSPTDEEKKEIGYIAIKHGVSVQSLIKKSIEWRLMMEEIECR